jgi:hypothetical protein
MAYLVCDIKRVALMASDKEFKRFTVSAYNDTWLLHDESLPLAFWPIIFDPGEAQRQDSI